MLKDSAFKSELYVARQMVDMISDCESSDPNTI